MPLRGKPTSTSICLVHHLFLWVLPPGDVLTLRLIYVSQIFPALVFPDLFVGVLVPLLLPIILFLSSSLLLYRLSLGYIFLFLVAMLEGSASFQTLSLATTVGLGEMLGTSAQGY